MTSVMGWLQDITRVWPELMRSRFRIFLCIYVFFVVLFRKGLPDRREKDEEAASRNSVV